MVVADDPAIGVGRGHDEKEHRWDFEESSAIPI